MLYAQIPTRFNIPWANSAGGGFIRPIPEASQIGIQAGAASLTDGFPPVTFLPIGAGGTPPWGADFNGILNQATAWLRWMQAGGSQPYNAAFSAAVGGYPTTAVVSSLTTPGLSWYNGSDGNTSDPDAGGVGWFPVNFIGGSASTGDWKWRPTAETLPGWLKANGTTIGSVSSGATQLAAATAFPLFSWHWTNFSNTLCPVSGGRGANPTADFAGNKTIAVLPMQGLAPIGMDTMAGAPTTLLSGVPVTIGSATQAGSILGENLHVLLLAELAAHNHSINDAGHNHGVTDAGHIHAITDPTHGHLISDPQHAHSINDPGHGHNVADTLTGYGAGGSTALTLGGPGTFPTINATTSISINTAATGISIVANVTGISVNNHTTGISVNSNTTGITTQNSGSNTAHNTVHRSMTGTHYLKL